MVIGAPGGRSSYQCQCKNVPRQAICLSVNVMDCCCSASVYWIKLGLAEPGKDRRATETLACIFHEYK